MRSIDNGPFHGMIPGTKHREETGYYFLPFDSRGAAREMLKGYRERFGREFKAE